MTNYIWNHFIAGKCVEGTTFVEAFNPSAGTPISKVAAGTSADVEHAVAAAEAALPEWRERKPMERGRVLLKIAAALREKTAELGTIEIAETGKPAWQAPFELELAAQYFEFYGGLVNVFQGEVIDLGSGYHSYTRREPYGVVGVITPWNAPLNQAARGIAPALAAGNVVVAKPSEFTSGTTVQLARIASECGLPDGVLNVVLGTGPDVGEAIVRNARVRKIAFTGSQRAGREIGKIAAERIIPLTLELGGKSPNIVFEDANLKEAVPGAIRAFAGNAGQVCLAGTRLLVQNSIHDVFVQHLVAGLSQVKVGKAPDSIVGPLTTKAQYDRVVEFFEIAKADGATVAAGGSVEDRDDWGDGWFLSPTIYTGVTNDMRIAREEIFGPVLVVIPFKDEADAIAIANDTEYGLAAGIWTENLGRAHRVSSAIEAGQIYVNEYMAGGVETPLGGYKSSGYGREKGIEALHNYTQLKCVTMKIGG